MKSEDIVSRVIGRNTLGGFNVVLFLILALFIFTNIPALKLGLPYTHNWDEPAMMTPVMHTLTTGNFNQFNTPRKTSLYDGYIHWVILGASFVNFIIQTSRGAILDLGELNFSTTWDLEISHPSFYLTGRLVILISGVICLYLLYLIAARSGNKSIGLLSAFILAIVPRFGFYSTKTLPYVPMTLGVLLTVYFLLRYNETPSWKYLTATGLAIALAASARVTCIILLVPAAIVLLWSKTPNKMGRLCFLAAISLVGEIVINFHQLLSFDMFMFYLHRLILASKIIVPVFADGVPGFPQVIHYGQVLMRWFGEIGRGVIPLYYLGFLAIPCFFKKNKYRVNFIVWSIPGLLFLQLLKMKYNPGRQICFLMPFVSLLIAIGIYNSVRIMLWIGNISRRHSRRSLKDTHRRVVSIIVIAIVAVLILNPVFLFGSLLKKYRTDTKDSRTKAMLWVVDNIGPMDTVVIAEELRVHPHDLRLLKLKQIEDYCRTDGFKTLRQTDFARKWMVVLFKKLQQYPEFVYRQPDLVLYFFQANKLHIPLPSIIIKRGKEITPSWLDQNDFFGGYIVGYNYLYSHKRPEVPIRSFGLVGFDKPIKTYGKKHLFIRQVPINPRVDIFRIPPKVGVNISPHECDIFAPKGYFSGGDPIILYRRGNIIAPLKNLSPGKYRLWLNARGDKSRISSRDGPKIRIELHGEDAQTKTVIDDLKINSEYFKLYSTKTFIISPDMSDPRLSIEFYYDYHQRRGRVLYLKKLFVERQKGSL